MKKINNKAFFKTATVSNSNQCVTCQVHIKK